MHLAGEEEQAVGLDGVRVRPRGGRPGVRGHGFARMGHGKERIRDAESPRLRDIPVPAAARRQPRGLVSVGRRGVRARARDEDKPILVSIGYAACHWCHVMEHESFEDAAIAAVMNDALRVHQGRPRGAPGRRRDLHGRRAGDDRPRRLAAERVPDARRRAVLRRHLLPARAAPRAAVLARGAGRRRATRGRRSATRSTTAARANRAAAAGRGGSGGAGRRARRRRRWTRPCRALRAAFDAEHGGWGGAPKFPAASVIEFLLARGERAMPLQTLRRMAAGGIYDQIGGGFARYSVDARWLVPHFEKMLYDNALLARAYLHAFQVIGRAAVPARVRGDARLGAARAAPGRGRLRVRRWTPTPRASRASSTSGRRTRSARRSARARPTSRSRTSA